MQRVDPAMTVLSGVGGKWQAGEQLHGKESKHHRVPKFTQVRKKEQANRLPWIKSDLLGLTFCKEHSCEALEQTI